MRVMVLVKATTDGEAGLMPEPEMFEAMGRFNEAPIKAGVWLREIKDMADFADALTPEAAVPHETNRENIPGP